MDGRVKPGQDGWAIASSASAASRRRAAGVALQTGAVAHHGEVAAFGAGFADIALHPRFRSLLGDRFGLRRQARADRGRRALGKLAFQRRRALHEAAMGARTAGLNTGRIPCPARHQHQLVARPRAQEALRDNGGHRGGRGAYAFARARRPVLIDAAAKHRRADLVRRDMREVVAAEIGNGELAEDVVEDRGRVLDRVIALDEARRLEPDESEGLDIFLERHAILQAKRDGDGEIVHQNSGRRRPPCACR